MNKGKGVLALASLLVLVGATLSAQTRPKHRYSFNNQSGDATNAPLVDSVSGADGVVLGAGATFNGSELLLPGGSMTTQAYGDLPNGLISGLTDCTFEGWVTIDGTPSWGRIFDFGSTVGGEILGPGGGGDGLDYFVLTATRGTDLNTQRVELRDEDPAGGGVSTFDTNLPQTLGQQFHFAVTYRNTGGGGEVVTYRNGAVARGPDATGIELGEMNDVNNWLGRSNWTNDANMQGKFDEFRIYDVALNDQQVSDSYTAGPDASYGYEPDPEQLVPTLTEWGFIILMGTILFLGGAVVYQRRRKAVAVKS